MSKIAEGPREKLREIVAKNGDRILEDSERCEGLLKDHCGEHRREVSALVGALQERIPMELRSSWQSAMTPEAMRARLVLRLQDHRGLAPDVADWAVDAWSYALGVGLGRSSDRLDSQVVASQLPPVPQGNPQWVGSQVYTPAAAAAAAASAEQLAQNSSQASRKPPSSGAPLKGAAAIAALAIAGYFAMPLINPPKPAILDGTTVVKPVVKTGVVPVVVEPVVVVKPQPFQRATMAVGTPLSVRISETLTSSTATVGQYVNATLTAPAMADGRQVLAAGTKVVLQVTNVDRAGRLAGVPQINLSIYQVEYGGKAYPAGSTAFVARGPSRTKNTLKKAGIGAAIGCGVGTVVGVFTRKPKTGCGVGAAGGAGTGTVVAATDDIKPAVITAGAVIQFSLMRPLSVG